MPIGSCVAHTGDAESGYLFTVFRRQRKRTVDLEGELGIETNEVSNLGTAVDILIPIYIPSLAEIQDWIPDPCGFPDKTIRIPASAETAQLEIQSASRFVLCLTNFVTDC